jgi:hypothetical protein
MKRRDLPRALDAAVAALLPEATEAADAQLHARNIPWRRVGR